MTDNAEAMISQNDAGVIEVFPKWPAGKSASFSRLPARGGFEISGEHSGSRVMFVDIYSKAGGEIRFRNPWRGHGVRVVDEKRQAMEATLMAGVVTFTTVKDSMYHVTVE